MPNKNRLELSVVLTGDGSGLTGTVHVAEADLQSLGRQFDQVGAKARGAGEQASAGLAKARDGADSAAGMLQRMRQELAGIVSAAALVEVGRGLARMADEYANIGARLRLASDGTASFADAQRQALAVAQRTGAALSSTADLIGKLSTSFRSLGGDANTSFKAAVQLSQTINQAVALSGASAASADAAIVQLGQGLASGTLRGDELNSVMEQTPRLARAIAEGMGVTVGQLRNLGQQGQITAKQIVDALSTQASKLAGEYQQLPLTIGRSWTQLQNAVLSYVGTADQASGVSRTLAQGISTVAQHIDDIGRAVVTLGEVVATVYAAKMIRSGSEWIVSLAAQSASVAANGVAVEGWGAKTAASFSNAMKNIGALGIAFNVVGSAIAGWQVGSYLRDQFLQARLAGVALVDGLLSGWENIKYGAQVAWTAISFGFSKAIESMRATVASFFSDMASRAAKVPDWLGGGKLASAYQGLADAVRPVTDATADYTAKLQALDVQHAADLKQIHSATDSMADYEISQQAAANAAKQHSSAVKDQGDVLQKLMQQLHGGTASLKAQAAAAKAAAAATRDLAKLADMADEAAGRFSGPLDKAWADSAKRIRDIATLVADLTKQLERSGVPAVQAEARAHQVLETNLAAETQARNRALAAARDQIDVAGKMVRQIQQEAELSTLSARDQAIARAGMQAEQQLRQGNLNLTQDQIAAQREQVESAAAAAYDMEQYAQRQNQIAQEFAGFWENAASSISKEFGDLFTGQIHDLRDFTSEGKSILQQWVSDIIAQFLRLRVLGPILGGAMNTVAGWLGITGDLSGSSLSLNSGYYGSGSTVGTTAGSLGGAGGYASYVQNGLQAYRLYNWASGLLGGSAAASPAYAGSASVIDAAGNIGGNFGAAAGGMYAPGYAPVGGAIYNVGTPAYTPWGGSFSIGGYSAPYASAAGGALGAYYGLHQGGGGFSTGVSTVGYGALGAGIAGTAAGVAGGASLGTAATGAFGAAAASTSWIPIVGWIMAGLAALDHFSGGKVFGTDWRPAQSNVTLGVGPDGSSASANELLWKYKGQTGLSLGGFLTGGLSQLSWWGDKKTKTEQLDVTPEMLQAAQQLYDSMEKVLVSGAQKLGTTVPDMITASLTAQTTYNKKGKAQGTEYLVQYLGQTWKEATAEAASERLGADVLLSVVAASAGDVANQIAKQWQDSADTLADGVQTLLEAQQDIVRGNSLVALGSSATLKEVIAFTQSLQQDGEKLADTYTRLQQASAAYEQFVGQFQPTSTDFGASLEAIAKQMQANIDQANQLAQAAGMQAAAESDLANIHEQAAEQAATAIAQLNSAAQDLAAKLYNVSNTTLSAVSAQLDKLQGKTQSALQLAIGDSSPYSDKQKLDLALQGLRSGLTSADDVLALGRKLYASSADYTGLYNKVQDILGLPGASGQQSLQDALSQYTSLYGQQQQLQAQADASQRFTDAKTLAQYVADISTTHGIGYNEAAQGLGFNLNDLAKDLGVQNITGYLDSLKLQDIPGTTMEASASIVDAIQKLGRDLIQTLTSAPITSATGVTGSTATATAEQTALLKSIDQRLAAIEGSTSDTAATNKTMAKDSASQKLNQLALTGRGIIA